MKADPGYFGPQSMMWKVNKEITVLFGSARALLMHAAHPYCSWSKTDFILLGVIHGKD